MNLGTDVPDEVLSTFRELTMKKKFLYIILEIEDRKKIIVKEAQPRSDKDEQLDYDAFKEKILADYGSSNSCYGILDFVYEVDGETKNKVVLLLWNPEDAGVSKFIYSGALETLRTTLDGVQKCIQAFEDGDLDKEEIIGQCEKL